MSNTCTVFYIFASAKCIADILEVKNSTFRVKNSEKKVLGAHRVKVIWVMLFAQNFTSNICIAGTFKE